MLPHFALGTKTAKIVNLSANVLSPSLIRYWTAIKSLIQGNSHACERSVCPCRSVKE